MEAAPAAALVMPEPEFLLEFLVIALDAPAQFRRIDQAREGDVLRQGREPVLGGLRLSRRPFDEEPFLRTRRPQEGVAMGRAHALPGKARGEPVSRAFPPPHLGPGVLRQTQRERLD